MKNYQTISNIAHLVHQYNFFIIDLCGVMHNGIQCFEEAVNAVQLLQKENKDIIFFSNAPRPSDLVKKELINASDIFIKSKIVTSGDFFLKLITSSDLIGYEFLKRKVFIIGPESKHILLQAAQLNIVNNIQNADYILILKSTGQLDKIYEYDSLFLQAISLKLPCVCPNPDFIALHGNELIYTPGSYAKRYQEMGGNVHLLGKPCKEFYLSYINIDKLQNSKLLAIGDNLDTDILGAINLGIDSLLITEGIYFNQNITNILNSSLIQPTYIMDFFR